MTGRRDFLRMGALAAVGAKLGCFSTVVEPPLPVQGGRLQVRWAAPTRSLAPGEHLLGSAQSRTGYIRVPPGYRHDTPAPLALLFHGAGRDAWEWQGGFPLFDALGMVVVSVSSWAATWDLVWDGAFGVDVQVVDDALRRAFDQVNVDRTRMAVAGFSDGASYALSLGLTNGDLFSHVLGFSPGFMQPEARVGTPSVWVSHGSEDVVLPVELSHGIVEALRSGGYTVHYEEYTAGHTLPYVIGEKGFRWFLGSTPP